MGLIRELEIYLCEFNRSGYFLHRYNELRKSIRKPVNQIATLFEGLWGKTAKEISYGLKLFDETRLVIFLHHLQEFFLMIEKG